jgi:hypothetical protein
VPDLQMIAELQCTADNTSSFQQNGLRPELRLREWALLHADTWS